MGERWPTLSDDQRLAWLRLIRTPRIGPALFQDLLNLYGSAQGALDALPHMSARRGVAFKPADSADIEREMAEADRLGCRFLASGEEGYPRALAHSPRPPPILCAMMNTTATASKPCIAIVGARNASAGGLTLAKRMACALGEAGIAVVSGLARGVDAAAHLGALATGTLAFTAGGLARPYPPEHADLMKQIADKGGAVYSEMPLGWAARAQDFPKRNRLVAGSSLGVVIVEAARRSGSLITARQAGEMGRLVMAVPGFPLDPRSDGPNSLIRQGATLVTGAQDILEEIGPMLARPANWEPAAGSSGTADQLSLLREEDSQAELYQPADANAETLIEQAMGFSPVSADTLIETTGVPTAKVRVWLVEHELAGRIVRSPGDRFAWNPDRSAADRPQ